MYDGCRRRLKQRDRKYTGSTARNGLLGSRPSSYIIFDAKQGWMKTTWMSSWLTTSTLSRPTCRGRLRRLRWTSTLAQKRSEPLASVYSPSTSTEQVSDTPTFDSLKGKISDETLRALTSKPFHLKQMTFVQSLVTELLPGLSDPYNASTPANPDIPRDLLVRARTGTGKTLAFLIPAVENRLKTAQQHAQEVVGSSGLSSSGLVPRAASAFRRTSPGPLILSPTRELAIQIANVALKLTEHHPNFQVRLFVGGASKSAQLSQWKSSHRDIVVATPGRMRDLLENSSHVRESMKSCNFVCRLGIYIVLF